MANVKRGCAVSLPSPDSGSCDSSHLPTVNRLHITVLSSKIPSVSQSTRSHRKALGQHFLSSGRILNRIVAAANLTLDDLVEEIGPGAGALTVRLLEQAGRVVAVELDPYLSAMLPGRVVDASNLTVVEADARHVNLASLVPAAQGYKVAANLPYYAANRIVRRFLEADHKPILMVLTLQQEVASATVSYTHLTLPTILLV